MPFSLSRSQWLRQLGRILRLLPPIRRTVRRPNRRARLRLLECEARVVPANVWTGAGGNLLWTTPSNWSLGHAPTSSEDVDIPDIGTAGANVTISLTST